MSELRTNWAGAQPTEYFANRVNFGSDGEQVGAPYDITGMNGSELNVTSGLQADVVMKPEVM